MPRNQLILRDDTHTEYPASRQCEVVRLSHYANAYYWSGGGYLGGAMYPNVLMPDYDKSVLTHASTGRWQPKMAQCKSIRHAHKNSQFRRCRPARNGLNNVYVLESLTQHSSCWLCGPDLNYGYPINGYGYEKLIVFVDMGASAEAQSVANTKIVSRFDALRHALFKNPHGRQTLSATSNGPTTALDNR